MQAATGPESNREVDSGAARFPLGTVFSVESQLKLLSFREYAVVCNRSLDELREHLSFVESNPEGSANLQKASERLGKVCIEADSWGFNSLYEVAQGLQMFLLNSSKRMKDKGFRETLDLGLAMLSALLERCESDFRWRLAIAETLNRFNREADAAEPVNPQNQR
jgi:hypothetical protein